MDLQFQFDSLAQWLVMSGHGPYVWACYGAGLLVVVSLLVAPWLSSRRIQKQLFVQYQRQLAARQQAQSADS